jgi:pilus assembly protein Flp/PilA
MFERLETFCQDEEGTTAIEYAFIASLVAVAGFATMVTLGDTLEAMYGTVSNGVANSISGG